MAEDPIDPLHTVDHIDEAFLRRVRTGVSGIAPRHDAVAVLQHHVGRRRRRRRVVATVASVAAAAVVVPVAVLALQLGGGNDRVEPASDGTTGSEVLDGTRPIAFFTINAGGRARGLVTQYAAAKGERYNAQFLWYPRVEDDYPVQAGVAVERFDGDAAAACADLVSSDEADGSTSACSTTSDGQVVRIAEATGPIAIDAVNGRGVLSRATAGDQVRAVTVFRADGFAVSAVVCACVAWQGPDLDEPPLTGAQLADIMSPREWAPAPDGADD